MKKLLFISLLSTLCFFAKAQSPAGIPTIQYSGKWYRFTQFLQADSAFIPGHKDTSWTPRFTGTQVYWENAGVDTGYFYWTGARWFKISDKSNTITAAGNGLTLRNDSVILGGTMYENTTVSTGLFTHKLNYETGKKYTNSTIYGVTDVFISGDSTIVIRFTNNNTNSLVFRPLADHNAGFGYNKSELSTSTLYAELSGYSPFTLDSVANPLPAELDSSSYVRAAKGYVDLYAKDFRLIHPMKEGAATDSSLVRDATTKEVRLVQAVNLSFQTLTYSSSITWDVKKRPNGQVTLAGTPSLTISNFNEGETVQLFATQDGTGSRDITFPAGTFFLNGIATGTTLNLTNTAGATDIISIMKRGSVLYVTFGYFHS